MNWDDLRHFAVFAERGSLLAAAKTMGVEHATVARRIEALEQALNLKLVDRRGRRLNLTPDGERIAAIANRMEGEAEAIPRIAKGASDDISGEIILSVPPAFGAALVAPCLGGIAARYPRLVIRLQAETRQASLDRREADIAIRLSRPTQGDLTVVKLMEICFRAYASPSFLANRPRPDWCFIGSDGDMRTSPQQAALEDLAGSNRFCFWASDVLTQMALARADAGIAMLPDFLDPQDEGLVRVFPDQPDLVRDVWLVVHNDLRRSAPVRVIIDHLKQAITPKRRKNTQEPAG